MSSEQDRDKPSNTKKDPDEWTTGDEPMTGAQRSYLKTLSDEAGEPFDDTLTKAEASKRIDALQRKTGRGTADRGGADEGAAAKAKPLRADKPLNGHTARPPGESGQSRE
jgi:hypothetical protein